MAKQIQRKQVRRETRKIKLANGEQNKIERFT